jgi:hypothetical protein
MTAKEPLINFLWFVVCVVVLYIIWLWNHGQLGNWAIPIVFVVGSIPALVNWLLKIRRKEN